MKYGLLLLVFVVAGCGTSEASRQESAIEVKRATMLQECDDKIAECKSWDAELDGKVEDKINELRALGKLIPKDKDDIYPRYNRRMKFSREEQARWAARKKEILDATRSK